MWIEFIVLDRNFDKTSRSVLSYCHTNTIKREISVVSKTSNGDRLVGNISIFDFKLTES
uniref:Uncharacterized protein n=1 Tax=Tetranychus urticae TaxID=32264 RepID=T1JWB2_TETUR